MRRKGMAVMGLGLAGALTLSACGGDDEGDGGGTGPITFWDTSNTAENSVFQDLISQCEADNEGLEVSYVPKEFGQARDAFKTAAQAGEAPDVLRADIGWVPEFASLGYLASLDGTAASEDFGDYLESTQASNIYEDTQYGIPQVTDALAMLYNKQQFTDAGITEAPTDYDSYKAALQKLKDNGSKAPMYMHVEGYFSQPYLYGQGGGLVDTDNETIIVNNADSVGGWDYAQSLVGDGLAGATADLTNSYGNMMTALKSGDSAVIWNGPWSVPELLGEGSVVAGDNLGIAPLPVGSAGVTGSPIGGHDYVVYAGSEAQESAITFITCMNSLENQVFLANELGLLPTRSAAYDELSDNERVAIFKEIVDGAQPRVNIPQGSELLRPLDQQFGTMVTGGKSAQEALDTVAGEYQTTLPDYAISE